MSDDTEPIPGDAGPETEDAEAATGGKPASDRLVMITGITSGIGRAAAEDLAAKGCAVIGVARDSARGTAAVEEIRRATGNDSVELMTADLSLMSEVRALARSFGGSGRKLDVLVNNAGVRLAERRTTAEGLETTLAVNHLAPYLLATLLEDQLAREGAGRVVNVSSFVHSRAQLDLDDLQAEKGYDGDAVYRRSKLLSLMATYALARAKEERGVTFNAYNPGWVRTAMTAGGPSGMLASLFAKSPRLAGESLAFVAVSPRVEGVTGAYFQATGQQKSSSAESYDEELQKRVVELTDSLLNGVAVG